MPEAETLEKSGLYGPSFKAKRCVIPADAFYEWKKIFVEKGVVDKQPMCIGMKDGEPFSIRGTFFRLERQRRKGIPFIHHHHNLAKWTHGEIHDRMPVILPEKNIDEWLDPENKDTAD